MATERPGTGAYGQEDALSQVLALVAQNRYAEARALCHQVLRERPTSAEAHAAMGDVAAAEGAWTEAVQWYELALDLGFDPQVMEKLAAARSRGVRRAPEPPPVAQTAPPIPLPPPVAQREPTRYRAGLIAAGAVALLLVMALVMNLTQRSGPRPSDLNQTPPPAPSVSQPPMVAPSTQTGPAGVTAVVPAAPPVQPQAPAVRYTGAPPVGGPRPSPRTSTYYQAGPLTTTREQQIQKRMHLERWHEGTSLSQNISLAMDSYSGLAILTLQAPRTTDLQQLEVDVLTGAFRAALSAMRNDATLNTLIIRCVTSLPNEGGEYEDTVVFRATATRDAMKYWLGTSARPSLDQARNLIFSDIWWDRAALQRYIRLQTWQEPTPRGAEPTPQ